jgi:hypothetical protein
MSDPKTPTKDWKKEYASGASAETFTNPAHWVQIVGAGTLVLTNEDGSTFTKHAVGGEVYPGVFLAFTSSTCAYVVLGTGPLPPAVSPSGTAAGVTIADAGGFTAQTETEGALQELYQDAESAFATLYLMPGDFSLLTGAPLAAFSNGASSVPGSAIVGSKTKAIRWNNNATLDGVLGSFGIPYDMDLTVDPVIHVRASKVGATVGDAVTFDVGLFNQVLAALDDADSDYGGTTSAMTGNATSKTVQDVTLTVTASNLPAAGNSVTLTLKPTDGTLGTDDLNFICARVVYKRKLRTA